jgi:hypothetical protein
MPPYTTHILVEISSVHNKERLLKTAGEKYQVTYKGKFIRIMADFSAETKKTRKAWNKVLQAMKKKKKTVNQDYCTQQSYPSKSKKKQRPSE